MRYTRIGPASYLIATLLVAVAAGVAWVRSGAEPAASPAGSTGIGAPVDPLVLAQDTGAAVYDAECRSCHGAGEERGRRIPALRGFAVDLFESEGGREYVIDFLFDGRVRSVEDGVLVYYETHPRYLRLSDAAAAGVLNFMLSSWGNEALLPQGARLYDAAEVAARRPSA